LNSGWQVLAFEQRSHVRHAFPRKIEQGPIIKDQADARLFISFQKAAEFHFRERRFLTVSLQVGYSILRRAGVDLWNCTRG